MSENALAEALGVVPVEVFVNVFNYMALLESAQALRELVPDMTALARMDRPGVIVTAQGDGIYDFISRYFAPAKGIPEDPVTGAAHCMLTPYCSVSLQASHKPHHEFLSQSIRPSGPDSPADSR